MARTHKGFSVINEEIAGKSTHDQLTIMRKKARGKWREKATCIVIFIFMPMRIHLISSFYGPDTELSLSLL